MQTNESEMFALDESFFNNLFNQMANVLVKEKVMTVNRLVRYIKEG